MKILFTGSGNGGHFYPVIAVAQEINQIVRDRKLLNPTLYYMAPEPGNKRLLFENNILFKKNPAGKMRRYFSVLNILDYFKTGIGVIKAVVQVFFIFPDVIFSKGGYGSFPVVLAARLFKIPLVIHESDSIPGKVNIWASDFATRIALSFPEAGTYFDQSKIAVTGNPVRKELYTLATEGAIEFLKLEDDVPVILILGGSQGAQKINELIVQALPELVEKYQILHQTGKEKLKEVEATAQVLLERSEYKYRYRPFEYLNTLALRMAAGASNIIISRGGSGIFEIALWGVPSIIIPLSTSAEDHQRNNAFSYARSNAAVVIEEANLTPNILMAEINRIITDEEQVKKMKEGAKKFAHPDAAHVIADELIKIALAHEK